jgi:predicted membrane protein
MLAFPSYVVYWSFTGLYREICTREEEMKKDRITSRQLIFSYFLFLPSLLLIFLVLHHTLFMIIFSFLFCISLQTRAQAAQVAGRRRSGTGTTTDLGTEPKLEIRQD